MDKSDGKEPEDSYFVNSDGQRIFTRLWYPTEAGDLSALVFICHGAGEHCQVYGNVAAVLTHEGILTFAHDHVGHGKSEGDRVHINTFNTFVNDVMQHVNSMKEKHPGLPCFIIGHSLGGLIAVKAALDHPDAFAGIVLIAPAIMPNKETVTPFLVFVAKLVARFFPQYQVSPIPPETISRDPAIVKQYTDDPLVWHGGLKARFSVNILDTMNEVQGRLSEIKWPFMILHGTDDKLCSMEGSQLMYDKASSKDKCLKVYDGAYHQVHNEPNGQGKEAIGDIVDWITRL